MEPWIIAVVVIAAVFAFFAYAARKGAELEHTKRARLAAARPTTATVVAAKRGDGSITRQGQQAPAIDLRLRVDGRELTARWCVFALGMAQVQEGASVPVRVDADLPDIVYPDADWAELSAFEWVDILRRASATARRPRR